VSVLGQGAFLGSEESWERDAKFRVVDVQLKSRLDRRIKLHSIEVAETSFLDLLQNEVQSPMELLQFDLACCGNLAAEL
jgi:hypothetical protein